MKKETKLFLNKLTALLVAVLLFCAMVLPIASAAVYYYPKYTGNTNSISTALSSLGVDGSYSNRCKIAEINGIQNYRGTAAQNTTMLNLLKQGKLIKAVDSSSSTPSEPSVTYYPKYNGSTNSISTALSSLGIDGSYSNRCKIAEINGIQNYRGTAAQNTTMLNLLKQGKLVKSISSASSTTPSTPTSGSAVLVDANANLSVSNRAQLNGVKYTSYEGQRSAAALNTVIDQYYVSTNSRYARCSDGRTWCNIYATDVTNGLNAIIPHWVKSGGVPASSGASGAWEMNANATYNWLRDYGASYGWTKVSAQEAQARANAGYPTVAVWKNSSGSGHIAIVRPEGNGYTYSSSRGPVIAQAGARCMNYANVIDGFGSSRMSAIVYYTHN